MYSQTVLEKIVIGLCAIGFVWTPTLHFLGFLGVSFLFVVFSSLTLNAWLFLNILSFIALISPLVKHLVISRIVRSLPDDRDDAAKIVIGQSFFEKPSDVTLNSVGRYFNVAYMKPCSGKPNAWWAWVFVHAANKFK